MIGAGLGQPVVEGSNPSAPTNAQRGDLMPRKTTKKSAKSKRRVVRRTKTPKKSFSLKELAEEPVETPSVASKPVIKKEHPAEYMGLHYETWINIILVVAVIIIVGILAGVGTLVHNAQKYSTAPVLTVGETGIGVDAVKARAKKVLDIIAGGQNYNITNVFKSHGVYEIDLSLKTPTGAQTGKAFMSLDGQMMYFRYLDVDQFLQRFENATINPGTNTTA